MSSIPVSGPGLGLRIANEDHRMTAEEACTKGDVMAVKQSVSTVNSIADTFDTVMDPNAANDAVDGIDIGIMCVALEDCAAGASGMFRFRGIVEALGGDTTAVGLFLEAGTNGKLVVASAAEKTVAIAMETMADGVLKRVMFDGFNGFSGVATA